MIHAEPILPGSFRRDSRWQRGALAVARVGDGQDAGHGDDDEKRDHEPPQAGGAPLHNR